MVQTTFSVSKCFLSEPRLHPCRISEASVVFIQHTEIVIFSDSSGMAKVPSAEDIVANVLITD